MTKVRPVLEDENKLPLAAAARLEDASSPHLESSSGSRVAAFLPTQPYMTGKITAAELAPARTPTQHTHVHVLVCANTERHKKNNNNTFWPSHLLPVGFFPVHIEREK